MDAAYKLHGVFRHLCNHLLPIDIQAILRCGKMAVGKPGGDQNSRGQQEHTHIHTKEERQPDDQRWNTRCRFFNDADSLDLQKGGVGCDRSNQIP